MRLTLAAAFLLALSLTASAPARADEFTKADTDRWQAEYQHVVADGRALWTDGTLGTNGVACGQCHPNAANTHPETYPKFQKQLGKVAQLWDNEPRTVGFDPAKGAPVDLAYQEPSRRRPPQSHY